jgi:4,5-dihydroxyphthalate decarboxylase
MNPARVEKIKLELPQGIRISAIPENETLDHMLATGAIDALVSPRDPHSFTTGNPNVGLLFPDYKTAEQQYYKKTGIFPIMHVVGIRRDLVERHPWLANSVYEAFVKAKSAAQKALEDTAALKVLLPWLPAYIDESRALMGADYWPYGVQENLPTLRAMVDFAHRHGTTTRPLSVEELFVPSTLERFKI